MESKINTSFTLYNHAAVERLIKENPNLLPLNPNLDIPKDLRWNQQHINSAITQGILQGKSIPDIAKDLQRVTGMDESAAIRNARTAMTGAQNAGKRICRCFRLPGICLTFCGTGRSAWMG